jgi:hypothetical protein
VADLPRGRLLFALWHGPPPLAPPAADGAQRADYKGRRTLFVSNRDHPDPRQVMTRRQMTELAVGAISALQDAGMVEEIDMLCERLFRLPPDRLFDSELTQGTGWSLAYKPMVELLLIHVREIGRAETAVEDRRAEIAWAVSMAGF